MGPLSSKIVAAERGGDHTEVEDPAQHVGAAASDEDGRHDDDGECPLQREHIGDQGRNAENGRLPIESQRNAHPVVGIPQRDVAGVHLEPGRVRFQGIIAVIWSLNARVVRYRAALPAARPSVESVSNGPRYPPRVQTPGVSISIAAAITQPRPNTSGRHRNNGAACSVVATASDAVAFALRVNTVGMAEDSATGVVSDSTRDLCGQEQRGPRLPASAQGKGCCTETVQDIVDRAGNGS